MSLWMEWLALAGVLVVLELFSGTFYLLMIALGLACGALLAYLGAGLSWQFLAAGSVASAATLALRRSRLSLGLPKAANDPNMNMDIGQSVEVPAWQDGRARVMYRGAMWDVELDGGAQAGPGRFTITEVRGNRLIVQSK
ncbi:NfeD family protein [Massilia sp. TS11]|uniref:NfeD family protein n=1 Tax=Massilia sp. TS11 TaxID=2908003 RepID=UPI001EDAE7F4|nr:NfeD family protein [Massilia sp. TS11]MCG2584106.1 NfeD family protein [Massilia sp. TS11]